MKIHVLRTGGTIDKVYFDAKSEFEVGPPMIAELLKEAHVTAEVTIEPVLAKDSLELSDADRQLIRERVAACAADRILITHGTDTMTETAKTLEDCVVRIQAIADAARGVNPDVLVICHGGPISEPPDAEYIIRHCRGVDGFYGASSVERLPAERAIADQIRTFKAIRRGAQS